MNQRELFLKHVAQTSPAPLAIEIEKAEGSLLFDRDGKKYIDLIGGISVCNIGHRHPKVVEAIHAQAEAYLHVLVYGEMIQSPQVQYASLLASHLPASLDTVYFTNSGAEATEGAMKLSKRVTGRTNVLAFNHSYHGSTQGALSIIGDEYWRNAFRPLLPGISHVVYNDFASLNFIDHDTACVFAETVQAESGINKPSKEWMMALRERCTEQGALLILDEIQAGFGRTGTLWAFEEYGIVPDILLLGKALGGGMPLGAFISSNEIMSSLTDKPVLGHITTFGGHPVCCAAGLAGMKALLDERWIDEVKSKEKLFLELLVHPKIKAVRSAGLWFAVEFESFESTKFVIDEAIANGVLTDWFLFSANSLRIAPPLVISENEIRKACSILLDAMGKL